MHARCTELRNACADRRRREETSTMRWSWCLAPVSIQFLCLFVRILPHGRQSLEICRAPGLGCCVEVSTGRDIDGNLVCPGLASRRRVTTGIRMLSRCRIFWRGGSQVHIACLGLGISNSLRLGTFKVLLPPQMPLHPTALEGMLLSFCPAFLRPVRSRPGLRKPQAPRWMDIRLSRSVHHPRVSTFVKVQAGVGRTNRFRDPGPGRKRGVLSFVYSIDPPVDFYANDTRSVLRLLEASFPVFQHHSSRLGWPPAQSPVLAYSSTLSNTNSVCLDSSPCQRGTAIRHAVMGAYLLPSITVTPRTASRMLPIATSDRHFKCGSTTFMEA